MKSLKKSPITEIKNGVRLSLYLQPRASKNEIVGFFEDSIKIRIAAPPVENEANIELINFLSGLLKIKKQSISILHGAKGRRKVVDIIGIGKSALEKAFKLRDF
ncbi:MAG: YggU family protein [Deltaproteobacteria bacterium RIFCSPHIGHO2_12_FULL_43_9]|nr:MAG: YggU family protein [Deltaproteobacteria bacterium RIFCSPHIGHO2_12_FULL_43_9]